MTDIARRGALRIFAGTSLGGFLGLSTPKVSSGALSVGAGINALSDEPSDPVPSDRSNSWWRVDRAQQGSLVYVAEDGVSLKVPIYVAPLKSVRPWAKMIIADHYEDHRRPYVDRLRKLLMES